MKRFLLICAVILAIYACTKKTSDPMYDSRLFAKLRAQDYWIFDSARITDSILSDTVVYAAGTTRQLTSFTSQFLTINNVKDTVMLDSATNMLKDTIVALDTTVYQITYNNPDKIYYYYVGGQVVPNQYLTIDTVNDERLILNGIDTLQNVSVTYYHGQPK